MLQKLILKNFQRHKKLVVDFDPYITTLVGATDRGKSAVIRALRWLMTNQPRGDAFIRHGTDYTYVTLYVDDHVIKRERLPGGNIYRLDSQEYQAFGSGVPDEIVRVLNTDPVSWQGQLDAPFLFSLSPGDTARELNRVVALDLIDTALANVASEVRRASDSVKTSQERLSQAESKCQALSWVQQADTDLQELEDVYQQEQTAREEVEDFTALIQEVEDLQNGLDGDKQAIIGLGALITAGEAVLATRQEVEELETLLTTAEQYHEEMGNLEKQAQDVEQELREMTGNRCPLCGLEGGDLL